MKIPHFKQRAISATVQSLFVASGATTFIAHDAFAQAVAPAASASAPTAATEGKPANDLIGLERVVVTATSQPKSKMRSSVSVTDLDQDQVRDFGAHTEAEVLLLIPGIRTDATAGPGGNANISVRGLPIASGGSKYVQLQEDGLPTVQFGDMNFSNNDYWIRFDNNVDSIQALRGGSASVFASHAPGAVINYISKTGKETGGSFGVTTGLNYNEKRVDGDYGGRLAPDLRYHFGGYARTGQGFRRTGQDTLDGAQFKGNITKEFNGGKGYVRAYVKFLDEHAPTYTGFPLAANVSGNRITGFSKVPGFDGTRDSQYSVYNSSMTSINPVTQAVQTSSLNDGIRVNSKSLGLEFHNEMSNGFNVDNKFRYSSNSGSFQTQFWNYDSLATILGNFGAGSRAVYSNGPKGGQAVTQGNLAAGLVSQGAAINVQTPNMGNTVNDLSVGKLFKLDMGTVDMRAGYYYSRQNVVQTWSISERVVEVGRNGAQIDVLSSSGAALTSNGLTGYNNQWGACCARDINTHFTTNAPYLSLAGSSGPIDLDAGVRHENFKSSGTYAGSRQIGAGRDVNGDGQITGAERNVYVADTANPGLTNYGISYTSYSLGANYRLNSDLSMFARTSKGNRAIADRLLYSPNIDPRTGQLAAGGGRQAAVAVVKQSELGVKYRGSRSWGNYGLFATVFHSTTAEFDYDQTRVDGPKLNQVGYRANGIELESALSVGNFAVNVNVVYSDEKITSDLVGAATGASTVGKTNGGVPKTRFTISPRYALGNLVFGATVRGQSWVWADNNDVVKIDGHYIVNAFANYDFNNGFVAAVNVSNVLNKTYMAGAATAGPTGVTGAGQIYSGGVEPGRAGSVSVRYSF